MAMDSTSSIVASDKEKRARDEIRRINTQAGKLVEPLNRCFERVGRWAYFQQWRYLTNGDGETQRMVYANVGQAVSVEFPWLTQMGLDRATIHRRLDGVKTRLDAVAICSNPVAKKAMKRLPDVACRRLKAVMPKGQMPEEEGDAQKRWKKQRDIAVGVIDRAVETVNDIADRQDLDEAPHITKDIMRDALREQENSAAGPVEISKSDALWNQKARMLALVKLLQHVKAESKKFVTEFGVANFRQHLDSAIDEVMQRVPHWICPECKGDEGDPIDPCPRCGGCGWLTKLAAVTTDVGIPDSEINEVIEEIVTVGSEDDIDVPDPPPF